MTAIKELQKGVSCKRTGGEKGIEVIIKRGHLF